VKLGFVSSNSNHVPNCKRIEAVQNAFKNTVVIVIIIIIIIINIISIIIIIKKYNK